MKAVIDRWLERHLSRWVRAVVPHSRAIVLVLLAVTLALLVYAVRNLGINSDNVKLVPEHLPSRQNHEAFARLFPNLENAMLVVIDGETPELARNAAEQLAARLAAQPEVVDEVYQPGGGSFFERNALLYRSVDELDSFADQMATMQPLIAALERDASMANLTQLVRQGLEAARADGEADEAWPDILDRIGHATVEIYDEYPLAVSWEEVLLRGSAVEVSTRQILVAHPVLDFDHFLPGRQPVQAIRASAEELALTPERGVLVRVTGNPAINYEEMVGIAWDIGGAGIFCFAVVVAILTLALRSLPLVAAAVATLLAGLVWTAAFAAASIGHLNLVSMAVAVLFLGLGIDFAIHLGMRYADLRRAGAAHMEALVDATEDVGSSLVLCTITTSIGFYVFVPTDYLGVAELGLIAGTGMLVIVFLTFTLFPALLSSWLPVKATQLRAPLRFAHPWWRSLEPHGTAVRWTALAAGLVGLALAPGARFDLNVVEMRDQSTETVQTFNDLLKQTGSASPWYVDVVADDLESADAFSEKLAALDAVSHTVTLSDYVPRNQEEKLEILADIAFLLEAPPPSASAPAEGSVEEQVQALRELHAFLEATWIENDRSVLGSSMRGLRDRLAEFLARIDTEDDPKRALESLEEVLLASLPNQVDRLRRALEAEPVTREDLPMALERRMLTADGRARIQVFPRDNLRNDQAFSLFVNSVQELAPNAAGVAVNLVGFADATKSSFRQALVSAVVAISLLLWLLWRRVSDMLLALTPLLLSSVLTVSAVAVLDIPFNFANVIVIPLLLGIGVDSGIHLVHRFQQLASEGNRDLMGSTTARAVFYSALTTTISFGSLAFSSHEGMKSLGILLTIGMLLTVVCNLIVLPALLELRDVEDAATAEPSVEASS